MLGALLRPSIFRLQSRCFTTSLDESIQSLLPKSSPDVVTETAKSVFVAYENGSDLDRQNVLQSLAKYGGIRHDMVGKALEMYKMSTQTYPELNIATTPIHYHVLRSIGNLTNGIRTVCEMRAILLDITKAEQDKVAVSSYRRLEASCRELLTTWFCLSNLKLNRLTWQSPGDILHKVAEYEAVHPVKGLVDFKKRLGVHRRCYYFTHEALPREPLVMVHVALTKEISNSVQDIMSENITNDAESDLTTAIYYSITSTQKGLSGIDLGNLLIKKVASEIQSSVPSVNTHSTLSPIPGFRNWLLRALQGVTDYENVVCEKTASLLSSALARSVKVDESAHTLLQLISANKLTLDQLNILKDVLMHLAAKYIYSAKRNGYALNPVANFHLRNGAELYRLNWKGDTSVRGINNSFGIMVNYRYYLENVTTNTHEYIHSKRISAHPQVTRLI